MFLDLGGLHSAGVIPRIVTLVVMGNGFLDLAVASFGKIGSIDMNLMIPQRNLDPPKEVKYQCKDCGDEIDRHTWEDYAGLCPGCNNFKYGSEDKEVAGGN